MSQNDSKTTSRRVSRGLGSHLGKKGAKLNSNNYLLYLSHIDHPEKSQIPDPLGHQHRSKMESTINPQKTHRKNKQQSDPNNTSQQNAIEPNN